MQSSREKEREKKAKWRAMQTNFDKKCIQEKDRADKARKRAMMTEDEKQQMREKDKLRKAAKRVLTKKEKISNAEFCKRERENNRVYQEKRRKGQSEGEAEYERISNILIKRQSRAKRSAEEKERDKKEAREGMKYVKILPFKKRQPKGQREEYMWWQFWKKSFENKEIIKKRLPKYAEKFDGWERKSQNPYEKEEKEVERQLAMTTMEKRDEKNRKCRLQREMILEKLRQPIDMPEIEMSEYELIRERNIAEIRKTMMESGLFEELK